MKPARATAERLLDAIGELVSRERIWLASGNFAQAAAVALRAGPLIARLREVTAADPALSRTLGPRVTALLARRRENHAALASGRAFLVSESRRIAEARRRLVDLAPVYGKMRNPAPKLVRLNAAV